MRGQPTLGMLFGERILEVTAGLHLGKAPGSLSEMERKTKRAMLEVGRFLVESWLGLLDQRYPEDDVKCSCGGHAKHQCRRDGVLKTVSGTVHYRRAYYWSMKAYDLSYYCDIADAETFGDLVWATGFQRQALRDRELIFLGHGADWIWDLVSTHYPQAVQIVDWFHAAEHLGDVAKAVIAGETEQNAWLKETKSTLWAGGVDGVIAALDKLAAAGKGEEVARKAAAYFDKHRSRMDYAAFRAKGYHIGSGTVESGCKQMGIQRMKVPGATWTIEGARRTGKHITSQRSLCRPLLLRFPLRPRKPRYLKGIAPTSCRSSHELRRPPLMPSVPHTRIRSTPCHGASSVAPLSPVGGRRRRSGRRGGGSRQA